MSDQLPDDIRSLWQSQAVEPLKLSLDEVRRKAQRFQRTIRWRNVREYIAALVVVVAFGWHAVNAKTLTSGIGNVLIVAGTLYVVYRLRAKGSAQSLPPDAMGVSCVVFHRRELQRQHELLRTVWKWYLGPLVPGLSFVLIDQAIEAAAKGPSHLLRAAITVVISGLIFFGIGKLNQIGARKIQEELRELESFES